MRNVCWFSLEAGVYHLGLPVRVPHGTRRLPNNYRQFKVAFGFVYRLRRTDACPLSDSQVCAAPVSAEV